MIPNLAARIGKSLLYAVRALGMEDSNRPH